MNDLLQFFSVAERLHSEPRTCELSNGKKQSVSGHMWMMSLMAITFAPKLHNKVDIEKVLKLITVHDLAEAETHDIPLHLQKDPVAKHDGELCVMKKFGLVAGSEIFDLWDEYEKQETAESKFVKALDKLDGDLQVSCSKTLDYVGEYEDGVYWRLYFSESRCDPFCGEPVLMEFFQAIRVKIESRMRAELGLDPDDFRNVR